MRLGHSGELEGFLRSFTEKPSRATQLIYLGIKDAMLANYTEHGPRKANTR
jgi:hypothetical protein